jgi:hypothetical protein
VIGIDAHPVTIVRARDNILANSLPDNICLVSSALGEARGFAPIQAQSWISGASLIHDPGRLPYQVGIDSLPNILRAVGVTRLDALVLDVMDFELNVLRGMKGGPYLPRLMMLSAHPAHCARPGFSMQNIAEQVAAWGYYTRSVTGAAVSSPAVSALADHEIDRPASEE